MTTPSTARLALLGASLLLIDTAFAAPDRIRGAIEDRASVVLSANVTAQALPADDRGALDSSTRIEGMKLILAPAPEQSAALQRLLERQRDPGSPDYRNWLSPEQYADRFGMSENDIGKLTSWLQSRGFTVDGVARARNWIAFSGAAGEVEAVFLTPLHRYESGGEKHFANASAPAIPASLAGIVSEIRGLNDFRPRPLKASVARLEPDFNSTNGTHYVAPGDLATIYDIQALYTAGYDGSGQKLVIAGQTDVNLTDLRGFRMDFNLPARDPQLVLVGSDPGVSPDDQIEANLDLEWSGAVARNATVVYVYSQNVFESLEYAIDQNLAPVISVSYGGCEIGSSPSYRTLAQQANAEGITWMNASGDSGAAGCDIGEQIATHGPSVTFPADIPEVTAVGGTEFNDAGGNYWSAQNTTGLSSALSYIPEAAWNDTALGNGLAAGGGGASTVYSKPWWQTGTGVPNDQARDVPDLALNASGAHDAYVIYVNGELMAVGGTSAASPSFAGMVAILNQYLVAKGTVSKAGLGNINPTLYSLAQTPSSPFHDIVTGNNIVPCAAAVSGCVSGSYGYKAGTGYDLATGLGSVDAYNLVTHWTGSTAGVGTTSKLTANPATIASSGTTQLTATVSPVTGASLPTGAVAFSSGNTALGSAAVTNATAGLQVKGSALAAGPNTITASFIATGDFSNSTAQTTVTVTSTAISTTTSLAANPTAVTQSGSTVLTATVKPASGTAAPAGSVSFTLGSTQLGTVALTASTAVLTVKASSLAPGANSITASYTDASGFNASTAPPITVTVGATSAATKTVLTASPATIPQTASTALTALVSPLSGTAPPTGTVTFAIGNVSLGAVSLSSGGSTAGVTLLVKGLSFALGANTVTATYSGAAAFAASSGAATVSVTAPPTPASITVKASPTVIAPAASTLLTATVTAAGTANSAPTGSVAFTSETVLGIVPLTASGTASLTVKGTSLALGADSITAMYLPTGNFTPASASVTLTVAPPAIATTMAMTARPAAITTTTSTQLTVTVRAASGTISPTGTIAFAKGNTVLGSATLAGSAGSATATLTVKGSTLAAGSNTISAAYGGNASFAAANTTAVVSVTAASKASALR